MLIPSRRLVPCALPSLLLVAAACNGNPEIIIPPGGGGAGGEGHGGEGAGFNPTNSGSGGHGGGTADPCEGAGCRNDQHCAVVDTTVTCVNNTCADLTCGPTETCQTTPEGGAICVDISCTTDLQCPVDRYCNGTICVPDVCTPGESTCAGQDVLQCDPNGGGQSPAFTCGSQTYYESTCTEDATGQAGCPCEDDWDCPAYTACEVGVCVGTGAASTCSLPPEPFANVLPTVEIQWGGLGVGRSDAIGSPFPHSAQNVMMPVVANLDDDNGDGLINELDFPEILFMTFCINPTPGQNDAARNGVLRAIHGGGPNKGKDFFAVLGSTVWHEGGDINIPYACGDATLNSTAGIAVGDLDDDGVPEIVAPTESSGFIIFSNTGTVLYESPANLWTGYAGPAPALANLDGQGLAEIVIGRHVFTLRKDATSGALSMLDHFQGNLMHGVQSLGPIPCVANLVGDPRQEIIAGSTVYALPRPPAGVTRIADCAPPYTDPESTAFCNGRLLVVWDGQTVNGATAIPNDQRDGSCAVADVLGADQAAAPGPANPLDHVPEVVLVNNGYLFILNGQTGVLKRSRNLNLGLDGGAPNVDDFDGDGFPEIGTAFGLRYVMFDLQDPTPECPAWPNAFQDSQTGLQGNPPRTPSGRPCTVDADCSATGSAVCNQRAGTCACLHNGWERQTEDNSSRVTGSSVFDFNGDGAAEVIYNDECYFRIYDGVTADILFKEHSPSRTRIEYPIVADVDNDGNAEIVFATSNESGFCSAGNDYNNGLEVWGAQNDLWVAARRIWNEHAYHVTNVMENGGIPLREPESWKPYNDRIYNTYRSNPRAYGVAPDLAVTGIQVSSPDASCGELTDHLNITVRIDNLGDLRVGPGVAVNFYGDWTAPPLTEPLRDASLAPLSAILQTSIEPRGSILLTVPYDAADNTRMTLPDTVRVIVDEADVERECNEDNNALTSPVTAGSARPDLRIQLGAVSGICPSPLVPTTIFNDGSAPVSDVVVRYYAGDPGAGGTVIHEETVAGPLAAGASTTFTATLTNFPPDLLILIYGVVDPDDAVDECNDGNNKDDAGDKTECGTLH